MPDQDDKNGEALGRLGAKLDAFDAKRVRQVQSFGETSGAGDAYRLLAVLIGGVITGLGLGWFFDRFAHTSPFGLIGGLLIGTAVAIYSIARSATRTADGAAGVAERPAVPRIDDENGG
jgi:ATP synthase protein I